MFLNPSEVSQIQAHLTKTPKPNLLNPFLRILSRQNPFKALHLYSQFLLHISDRFTFTYAIKACSLLHSPKALQIHARVIKSGHIHHDLFVSNSLINFYSSVADVASARKLFDEMTHPDAVSWASLVSALARHNCAREALTVFASMDLPPNVSALVSALPACSGLNAAALGRSVHAYGLKNVSPNTILDNAVLDMYFTCGEVGAAKKLFLTMPDKDVVSWTTVIAGYLRNGMFVDAIGSFVSMRMHGDVVPNEATLASVLRACASMGSLRLGELVQSYVFVSALGENTTVGNALINMYAKCGDMGMAFAVFNGLESKDLVSWCTIIGALAVNGRARAALQAFALMLCHGLPPDGAAFLAVLSACCHAGLVEPSLIFFRAMREVYGVEPQKEHCTCLIDTLGRTGRLAEAGELVRNLRVEFDAHVLGGMLSACKTHSCERAVSEGLEKRVLEGKVAAGGGIYVLISNTRAKEGRWDESISVREQMESMRIKKTAGCSWIEVCRLMD